ncbi:MAG: hypothetical protein QM683_22815 [Lacrimispora sp.]
MELLFLEPVFKEAIGEASGFVRYSATKYQAIPPEAGRSAPTRTESAGLGRIYDGQLLGTLWEEEPGLLAIIPETSSRLVKIIDAKEDLSIRSIRMTAMQGFMKMVPLEKQSAGMFWTVNLEQKL